MRSYCIACFGNFSLARASCPLSPPLVIKILLLLFSNFLVSGLVYALKNYGELQRGFSEVLYLLIFTIFKIPTEKCERYFQLILR